MDRVAAFIRHNEARISARWIEEVCGDHPAQYACRPVLETQLPEFIEGLANWVEGNTEAAESAFARLAEGQAIERLGYGVGLETLMREYSKLRVVITRELLSLPVVDADLRDSMLRLHEGLDIAVNEMMARYGARRDEIRERFMAILGHDLREPVATVTISARMLASNPALDREHRLVASRIGRACDRMQRRINDVLDFARGHLGAGIPAHPTPNDLGEISRTAVDEIGGANPQRHITVAVRGDLHGDLDRDRVHQALTNLISNAIHHTDGPIEIVARESHDRQALVTEVTSHGAVIPEELRRRIFDPFTQGETPGSGKGVGLGMFIVQQIAVAHGGTCDVKSDESGTTFSIRWPRPMRVERAAG
ncbi:MAG: HAMP domain-containing histidine kinase [Kofleriaceae bacterium]|nr:HAMP domain-containing histidine kinase [Kofleriaceae bacterium]